MNFKLKFLLLTPFVLLYMAELSIQYIENFTDEIHKIRQEYQISRIANSETKILSVNDWQIFRNQKELEIDGIYYDIIKAQKHTNQVIVTVVRDTFEKPFKTFFKTIQGHKKNSPFEKKKQIKLLSTTYLFDKNTDGSLRNFKIRHKQNHLYTLGSLKDYILFQFKPPCV